MYSCLEYSLSANDFPLASGETLTHATMIYTDYNGIYDRTSANRYDSILISGKSLDDAGFGGSDIFTDPQFNDPNACVAKWDQSLGGDSSATHGIDSIFGSFHIKQNCTCHAT